jgi:MSHA biogenesis protein MshE
MSAQAWQQKIRLGNLLIRNRLISEAQLQAALEEQKKSGRKLGRVLIGMGAVTEEKILQLLSDQLKVPLVDLRQYQLDPKVVQQLPEQLARRFRALVLQQGAADFTVAMADPTDLFSYDELSRLLRRPIKIVLAREKDILDAIDLVYRHTDEITSLAREVSDELESDYELSELVRAELETDVPVARLLQSMFEDAVRAGASDIHIEPEDRQLRIRQRIDGVLNEQVIEGTRTAQALVTRLKLLSNLDISEKRLPQDGRFSIRIEERLFDVRLATMPVEHGEVVVMRLLDQSAPQRSLAKIGMPPAVLQSYRRVLALPHGMILVTGPTGSGKTTTLYSTLSELNRPGRKIITAEDPVEYRLPRVNQVQVNPRIGLDFARILRSALRLDPDVIMVGEIRDEETAQIALRAAITGHLVLSTLHTNDTLATLGRLLDMRARGYLVASALRGVLAQRLIRRVCERCGDAHVPDVQETAFLQSLNLDAVTEIPWRAGKGCPYCNNTGYRGRTGVFEWLEITPGLAEAIRAEAAVRFSDPQLRPAGYRPLALSALDLARQGTTSIAEVMRVAGDTSMLDEATVAAETG